MKKALLFLLTLTVTYPVFAEETTNSSSATAEHEAKAPSEHTDLWLVRFIKNDPISALSWTAMLSSWFIEENYHKQEKMFVTADRVSFIVTLISALRARHIFEQIKKQRSEYDQIETDNAARASLKKEIIKLSEEFVRVMFLVRASAGRIIIANTHVYQSNGGKNPVERKKRIIGTYLPLFVGSILISHFIDDTVDNLSQFPTDTPESNLAPQ